MKFNKLQLTIILFLFIVNSVTAAQIIFAGKIKGQFDLYKTDTDFSYLKRFTATKANEKMPAVSSNKELLAYISDADAADCIYLKNLKDKKMQDKNISVGMGAYANPAFAPNEGVIAVRYAPDPQRPLLNTKIVLLDYKNNTQTVLIDSVKYQRNNTGDIIVVDRPLWISNNLMAYIVLEYESITSGRIAKSVLYLYDLVNKKSIKLAGGESYYDDKGNALGFKATMPSLIKYNGKNFIGFVAIQGALTRFPMIYNLVSNKRSKLNLKDEDFFGPILYADKTWLYTYWNNNEKLGLALRKGSLTAKRKVLNFKGEIFTPTVY